MIDPIKNNEPLDLSYLRDMSGDSAEFIIEMLDLFKAQTPAYVADLEKAITDKDWARASSCAHKIKPTFAYVGRNDAKDHMQMMERNARELNNVEELPKAFNEINEFVQVLYRQLDEAKAELEKRL
ncbi:Hpt domain-containing protein [Pedobacter caeni]|uniref:HPt (Histidine-containing phosphotransfer) domain-containing protein n=1 Tax=Pedobacter caeni TaxID=288992 RepID=A0A1M5AND0_9SPHI|nr:Hpt domain-containing protein [Pedobacter caeni]SHF31769.1 HPt (histidine-containing phosphotransfer) domain-containing protein [Pedobacter caeni]